MKNHKGNCTNYSQHVPDLEQAGKRYITRSGKFMVNCPCKICSRKSNFTIPEGEIKIFLENEAKKRLKRKTENEYKKFDENVLKTYFKIFGKKP